MTKLTEEEREEQKDVIREVAREFIDSLYREMGVSVCRALGILLVLGLLAVTYKLGMVDKLLGL